MALMLASLIGVMGLAGEASGWFYTARSMQKAADSAALAVSTTGCATVAVCESQAWAVTARHGFTNGANNVMVTSTAATVACPAPSTDTNCYQVTVSKKVPFYLIKVVGFVGDTTVGGADAQTIQATAIANAKAATAG
jgi:Flp pilus assembly protein TadG